MSTREDVFNALFALGQSLQWGSPSTGLAFTARRVKLWDDLPAQPALCQAEPDEMVSETTGLPSKSTYSVNWLIYHAAGKDPGVTPATETNLILDAVQALFPSGDPDHVQTLGGRVHHCFIAGKVFKDSGDLDGQALIIVPIKILVP
jgi:hypothetical protein